MAPAEPDDDGRVHCRLDELLETDPLAAERVEMRRYYLGDFPAETYAEGFLAAARRIVDR